MTEGGEDARGEKGGCRTAFRIGTMEGGEDARGKEGGCSICAGHVGVEIMEGSGAHRGKIGDARL